MVHHAIPEYLFFGPFLTALAVIPVSLKHFPLILEVYASLEHFRGLVDGGHLLDHLRVVPLLGIQACSHRPLEHVVGSEDVVKHLLAHPDLLLDDLVQFLVVGLDDFQQVGLCHLHKVLLRSCVRVSSG